MPRSFIFVLLLIAASVGIISSCVHKPYSQVITADGNFPQDVARILVAKCAVSGCHNAASYHNASELRLDTWDALFDGGSSGAVVVPFNAENSPLLYFVNTNAANGPVATPTMPESTTAFPQSPLTTAEYNTLKNWIASGAPDKNGNVAFSSNPDTRQKIYITQQGCDLLAVVDAEKHVVMRYIPIGASSARIESPHCVRAANDGMHLYASFLNGDYVQKIDTRTDQLAGNANVGSLKANGSWNILYVAPADTAVVTSSWVGDGILAYLNSATMNVDAGRTLGGGSTLVYPHGITSNRTFDTFYVTAQYGNVIYKMSADGMMYKLLSLNGNPPSTSTDSTITAPNPHEILMAPDYTHYFVTCQTSNEVRVLDAHTDSVLAHVSVGTLPQEMAWSTTVPYLFVSCMEDASTVSGMRGSVYAINYNTLETTVIYGDFYQPHGLAVDDKNGLLYVVSTNANPAGPAPHHATACSGRAGWYSIYDLHTLQPINNKRYQLTVMPYSATARFK